MLENNFFLYRRAGFWLYLPFLMIKTRKSIAKKFKVTASGKVMRRKAGHRHFLRNKTVKQKRSMRQDQQCSDGVARFVKTGCPGLF
ncbi:MAG: large subunit ribosomal protein L35 [Puniceicoccaceae bacterium 5H]|nr:MAG: large subunit ribosomal protein L35 [Puniceicoccaceae bacterium 5H]